LFKQFRKFFTWDDLWFAMLPSPSKELHHGWVGALADDRLANVIAPFQSVQSLFCQSALRGAQWLRTLRRNLTAAGIAALKMVDHSCGAAMGFHHFPY
jgi:hypothetical protein